MCFCCSEVLIFGDCLVLDIYLSILVVEKFRWIDVIEFWFGGISEGLFFVFWSGEWV